MGGFASLNNFPLKSYVRVLGKASYQPKTHQTTPQWTDGSAYSLVLAPADFVVQYDLNPLYQSGVNGAGQSIAIVNESNIDIEQVNQFRSLFGLPANPPQVIIDGNDPGIDGIDDPYGPNDASTEAYLDVEWSGAVAPDATIDLVIAADTALESGLFLAAEHAVYSNIAPVISLSFGGCEQAQESNNAFINSLWEQAAAQGVTVMVSSGDSGSSGCAADEYAIAGLGVNGLASTPYNVAVGGTDFYYPFYQDPTDADFGTYWNLTPTQLPQASLLQVIPEQPWNGSQYGLNIESLPNGDSDVEGGSGGASSCATGTGSGPFGWATCTGGYPKPSWQSGAGVPADNVRDIPDVSLFASNGWNYTYYPLCASDGDCQPVTGNSLIQITGVGGTSASSPAFAGMMALVNQKYGRQGQAGFVLYPLKAQFPAAFHDVTHGTNSVPCNITTVVSAYGTFPPTDCIAVANPYTVDDPEFGTATEGQLGTGTTPDYNAAAGYNLATGLGTIDANRLVANWGSIKFATTTTTLTPSSTAFTEGNSISVSGAVTAASGTPTGEVALMTDSTEPGQQGLTQFNLSNGSFSGTVNNLPGGTYNIWGQYSGDTSNGPSASAKTLITVSPENSVSYLYIYGTSSSATKSIPSGTTGIPYGTEITLNAVVDQSSGSSAALPTGTVTFKDGSTTLNTAVVNAAGEAGYIPPTSLNVGSHSITASYSGDNSYNPSTSTAVTFSISQVTPSVFIAVPSNPYTQGQAAVLTILVEGGRSGAAPTGSVTLTGVPAGTPTTATLRSGVDPVSSNVVGLATVTIPSTAATGTYTIGATYNPDSNSSSNYTTASESGFSLQITSGSGIATTTTASASSGTTSPTAAIAISGTVTAASGTAPTGTVYLLVGYVSGSSAGEGYISATTLVKGAGTSSTFSFVVNSQSLLEGTNEFTVYYAGSTTDAPSSAVLNISNPLSDFTLTPQSSIVPVSAGSNATDTIYIASVNGFSGAVSLACTAATGVTCSIPTSVSLASGGSTTATLTISAPASTSSGSYNVLLTGSNSTGAYVHTLGIRAIAKTSLSITTATTLPSGVVGTAYSQTLAASGGSGSGYSWTVTSGSSSLTAIGLSLSSGGVLSGSSPTAGSASFTVKVTDSASNTATASFSVTINATLAITTATTLPSGVAGTAYSQTLAASGGSGSGYSWTVTSGSSSLTAVGLGLSSGGIVSGSSPTAGSASFTVKVTDSASNTATANFSVTINAKLAITTATTLPSGVAGTAYSQTLAASGGSGSGYSWTVTSGSSSLTTVGLSLSSGGVVSGSSPTAGSASFTVKVTDSASNTATANFSVTINATLTITTATTLPTGFAGTAYSQTLAASGGSGSGYSWTVTSGSSSLTAVGLSLSSGGVVSGSSPTAGSASFTVKVTDSASNTATANFSVTINAKLTITTATTLPSGVVGTAYSQTLAASGGSGSGYSWTVTSGSSSLTAIGLSLSSGGVVSGASPTAGSASFTVKVTDSASNTATASFSVTINATAPAATFTITGTAVSVAPGATTGNTSTVTVMPSGGFTGSVTLTAQLTSSPSGAQYPPTLSFGLTTPGQHNWHNRRDSHPHHFNHRANKRGTCLSQMPRSAMVRCRWRNSGLPPALRHPGSAA